LIRYIAEFLDKYGLNDLHQKKSEKMHFNNTLQAAIKVDNLRDFYPVPAMSDITFEQQSEDNIYKIGKYSYKSEIDNGPSNKYSTGLYYENKSSNQTANVVIVHGWRMGRLKEIEKIYNEPFSKLGLNMYYFTLPYHFEREPKESLYSGELMISADIDRTLTSVKQTVTDLRALIRWIRANRKGKIILIGVSLGGFLVNLTGVLEKEIDILIATFYANSMAYSVWHTIPGRYIKQDFEQNGFSYEQLKEAWAIINPSLFRPVVKKKNILLLSGIYDKYVVFEDTSLLWESWERPKRILYDWGHAGILFQRRKIAKDTISFIKDRIL
jgi:hypothetical protein